jgi:hypothetical protein
MRKRPQWRLALAENFLGGFDHKPRVHDRGIDRDQDSEAILPSAVSLDAAVNADAVSADGLYLSNGCAKKLRHSALGYSHSNAPRSSSFLSLPQQKFDRKKPQSKSRFAHTRKLSHGACSIAEPRASSHSCALTLPNIETKKTLATQFALATPREYAPAALDAPTQAAGATNSVRTS